MYYNNHTSKNHN